MSGLIQGKAVKRGFTPADPRYGATINAVSGIAGSSAAGAASVVLGALTAPAWLTTAIAFGVGAAVTYGISLAIDGAVSWVFDPDPKKAAPITRQATSGTLNPALLQGGSYWGTANTPNMYASDPVAAITAFYATTVYATINDPNGKYRLAVPVTRSNDPRVFGEVYFDYASGGSSDSRLSIAATYYPSGAPGACAAGMAFSAASGSCVAVATQGKPAKVMTAQEAINDLPPEELLKPVNPKLLAAMADEMWKDAAAQPGYNGLPYQVSDPITETEVQAWREAHPDFYPKVADLVKPQVMTDSPFTLPQSLSPVAAADPSPVQVGTNPAASQPQQNLGSDPGIGAPSLESTPTAEQILKPIFDVMPGFKSFAMPAHTGTCPQPEFEALGQRFVMDQHCVLLDQNRSTLQAVMAAVWLLVAAFIVLRA